MRLSPPITVLSLIVASFVAMGVIPSEGKACFQTLQGEFTLENWMIWLKRKVVGGETPCDPWTSVKASAPIIAITVHGWGGGLDSFTREHEVTLLRNGEVTDYIIPAFPTNFDWLKQKPRRWSGKTALFSKVENLVAPFETTSVSPEKIHYNLPPNCLDIFDGGGTSVYFGRPGKIDEKIWKSEPCTNEPWFSTANRAIVAYEIVENELALPKFRD